MAHETGAASVVDPLGGAHFVEWMTDEIERQANEIFEHIDQSGGGSMLEGVYAGIDDGYFVGEIADAAYRFEREVNAGRRIIVGVNEFTENDDEEASLLSIGHDTEEMQLKRLEQVRGDRNDSAVQASLAALVKAAEQPDANLMPPIINAVQTYATEGEIVAALETVFGTYVETAVV